MKVNHKEFALFDYEQYPPENDRFKLGDVVIEGEEEPTIGVIIQTQGGGEYRTDKHGNISDCPKYGTMRLATDQQVLELRPELISKKLPVSS